VHALVEFDVTVAEQRLRGLPRVFRTADCVSCYAASLLFR
jgi:hypothetical protein